MTDAEHPAVFSDTLLPIMAALLKGAELILDPFGGVGKARLMDVPGARFVIGELEWPWARQGCDLVADATRMPYATDTFAHSVSSPTYGSRMADSHKAKDDSVRHTYTHTLRRTLPDYTLHKNNTGKMNWGKKYRVVHVNCYRELKRVLKPGGVFVLNMSDHYRKWKIIPVCDWHESTLNNFGFRTEESHQIETPRQRHGANGQLRVEYEMVYKFVRGA